MQTFKSSYSPLSVLSKCLQKSFFDLGTVTVSKAYRQRRGQWCWKTHDLDNIGLLCVAWLCYCALAVLTGGQLAVVQVLQSSSLWKAKWIGSRKSIQTHTDHSAGHINGGC